MTQQLPQSQHFQLVALADGVFAALAAERGAAFANAGIIDLGNLTLTFDSFVTPVAAGELAHAARQLTGRPVDYAINSHWHADHMRGNIAFPKSTQIVSSQATYKLMTTASQKEFHQDQQIARRVLADLEEQLKEEHDELTRQDIRFAIAFQRGMVKSLPDLELRLPTLTFEKRLTLRGEKRTAVIRSVEQAHTQGDTYLYLPDEDIAFMGDLVFVQRHPWLGDGHPDAWMNVLAELAALDLRLIVPGHGPVGKSEDFDRIRQYIEQLTVRVRAVVDGGRSIEEAAHLPVPADFVDWRSKMFNYERNLRFLYQRLAGATS